MNIFQDFYRHNKKSSDKSNPLLTNPRAEVPSTGLNVYFVGNKMPIWINTQKLADFAKIVSENPIVYSTLAIRSNYIGNAQINVKDLKTGEIITRENLTTEVGNFDIVSKIFKIFYNPNPLQSRWEFLKTYLFMKDTFGTAFTMGTKGIGAKMNIENIISMWNIWPQWMNVVLKSKYFSATILEDLIDHWKFGYDKATRFDADQIMMRKDVNVNFETQEDLIFGMSRLVPLTKPISNIKLSYESENVVLQNRGARMVITPQKTADEFKPDAIGHDDQKELEEEFNDYGFLDGQKNSIVSRFPVDVNMIDQDIRKLGIFETIATDALAVAHGYNVPELLVKLYIQGTTFENQNTAIKSLYENTIIPEFEDYIEDMNVWLKIPDYGYQIIPTFDHIAVLQEDKKEKAIANRQISAAKKEQFYSGGCTWNEWRTAIGDSEEDWGEKRITELDDRELSIVMGTYKTEQQSAEKRTNGKTKKHEAEKEIVAQRN